MKKVSAFLLAFVMLASLALPAFADGVGPFMEELTAYVNKKGGADVYEYAEPEEDDDEWELKPSGKKIPDKTKLTLTWYEVEDDEIYYNVEYEKDEFGYVRAADLSMDLKPVEPKEENKYEPALHFIVIEDDGAKLYAGPGLSYEVIDTLPEGTVIEAAYADGYDTGSISTWSYTTVDGKSGWVHTGQDGFSFDFGIPVKYKEYAQNPLGKLKVLKGMKIYDDIEWWKEDAVGEIPAGTEISFDFYYNHQGEILVPVSYKGTDGWVKISDPYFLTNAYMNAIEGYLMATGSPSVFEDDDLQPGEETDITVEDYEILPYDWAFRKVLGDYDEEDEEYWDAAYEEYYRVTIDGEKYWMRYGSELGSEALIFSGTFVEATPEGVPVTLYSEPDADSEKLCEIGAGEEYIQIFRYDRNEYFEDGDGDIDYDPLLLWQYVEYNGQRGWIHYESDVYPDYIPSLNSPRISLTGEESDEPGDEDNGPGGFLENLFGKKDDKDDGDDSNPLAPESPKKTIAGSVGFAAVTVILAAIGIARARKKKEE